MRRILAIMAVVACGFATPAYAQQEQAQPGGQARQTCQEQMAAVVGPLLQQSGAFNPEGYAGTYGRLTQPFANATAVAPYGYPTAWWGAPPTAAYNASAAYTTLAGLQRTGLTSQALSDFLVRNGQLLQNEGGLTSRLGPGISGGPFLDPAIVFPLAQLQQAERSFRQTQALFQQQQALLLNSLYLLAASYQVSAVDWSQAYALQAQGWLGYFDRLCGPRSGS